MKIKIAAFKACTLSLFLFMTQSVLANPELQVLRVFTKGSTNAYGPGPQLAEDANGNLFGTTTSGGANGFGTVFKLAKDGVFTSLFDFGGTNGSFPFGLMSGADGNFYGVTIYGGNNLTGPAGASATTGDGTIFKITPGGVLTTLYYFNGTNGHGRDRKSVV